MNVHGLIGMCAGRRQVLQTGGRFAVRRVAAAWVAEGLCLDDLTRSVWGSAACCDVDGLVVHSVSAGDVRRRRGYREWCVCVCR